MKELDFGVFYTCYTEYESVKHSLKLLYDIYPTIPVYLVSDGGSDYKELENQWSSLKTNLEHDSRGFVPKINDSNFTREDIQDYMKKSIFTFLERIQKAIYYCNKPYILIMEPDVLVRGKLHIQDDVHLLGSRINTYHWAYERINAVLKDIPGSLEVTHYGATPAIFSVESYIKVYKFFIENENYIDRFCRIDPNFANYDITLAVLFSALGYPEIYNTELVECLREKNWQNTTHPLLHQFRVHYPKSNYDGRHK